MLILFCARFNVSSTYRVSQENVYRIWMLVTHIQIGRRVIVFWYLKSQIFRMSTTSTKFQINFSRRMRWTGHVARMGEERKLYNVLVWKPKKRDHSEDQGVGGRMGSEWILGRLAWGVDCIRLAQDRDRGELLRWWTFGFFRHGVSYLVS
jgi:hypothetical protein